MCINGYKHNLKNPCHIMLRVLLVCKLAAIYIGQNNVFYHLLHSCDKYTIQEPER